MLKDELALQTKLLPAQAAIEKIQALLSASLLSVSSIEIPYSESMGLLLQLVSVQLHLDLDTASKIMMHLKTGKLQKNQGTWPATINSDANWTWRKSIRTMMQSPRLEGHLKRRMSRL